MLRRSAISLDLLSHRFDEQVGSKSTHRTVRDPSRLDRTKSYTSLRSFVETISFSKRAHVSGKLLAAM